MRLRWVLLMLLVLPSWCLPMECDAGPSVFLDEKKLNQLYQYVVLCKKCGWFGTYDSIYDSYISRLPFDIRKLIWRYFTFSVCEQMIQSHGPTHYLIEQRNSITPHVFDCHAAYLREQGKAYRNKSDSLYPSAPVYWASVWDEDKILEKHLKEGHFSVDGEGQSYDCATPLHCAAWFNCCNAARILLKYHANVDAKTPMGRTPLHIAVSQGYTEMAAILLAHSANLHEPDRFYGLTPYHLALTQEMHTLLEVSTSKRKQF